MTIPCPQQWFDLARIGLVVAGAVIVLWRYIDRSIKMSQNIPVKSNKTSARVKAAGFLGAFIFLQLPYAKTALDFKFYNHDVMLYGFVNAGTLLAALWYGGITGGTYLTNPKNNATNADIPGDNNSH